MVKEEILDIKTLLDHYERFSQKQADVILMKPSTHNLNHNANGVMFLKPEICNIPLEKLSMVLEYIKLMANIYSEEIYMISGKHLIQQKIIDDIYKRIKKKSTLNIGKETKKHQHLTRKDSELKDSDYILGSLELAKKGLSPEHIIKLWEQGPIIKMDNALYGIPCVLNNIKVVLTNGFFPYQYEQYISDASKILLFFFKTKTSFPVLKRYFQGSAEPFKRHQNSIRQYLADFMVKHSLGILDMSRNGIHLSENQYEGKKEVKIFTESLTKHYKYAGGN